MPALRLEQLAVPAVTTLVAFLAYSSQYLFHHIEPGPIRGWQAIIFNTLVVSLLVCYLRTCFTHPGKVPKNWTELGHSGASQQTYRFCRKCQQHKPPRSHHCKTCECCVPKMDHHCMWTANCISYITFPHFVRFLFHAVAAMAQLELFLYTRCAIIWRNRHLPSYLGPNIAQLALLFLLVVINSMVLLALSVLFSKIIVGLAMNVTTIEGWEIERHHALVRRSRVLGGLLTAPDGSQIRIEKQEFPWDIGILSNIAQGMGTSNPFAWFWPFAVTPRLGGGLSFKHNEIEDPSKPWPPPDPDRMFRDIQRTRSGDAFTQPMDVASFKARQSADLQRYAGNEYVVHRRPFHERYQHLAGDSEDAVAITDSESGDEAALDLQSRRERRPDQIEGEEAWRTREGERLADFGVDEEVEFYDEDDLPLSELIRRQNL